MSERLDLTQIKWLKIYPALEDVTRCNMLIYFHNEGPKRHSDLAKQFVLDEETYMHYVNLLMQTGLAKPDYEMFKKTNPLGHDSAMNMYVRITEMGEKVLKTLLA